MTSILLPIDTLRQAATALLTGAGLGGERAEVVAHNLVTADRMGHRTHGLNLLPHYLRQLDQGGMAKSGEVTVVHEGPASFFWQAHRLPGAFVLNQAIDRMIEKTAGQPVVTASIAECFHIGSLQVYLERVTRRGLICILSATDPAVTSVAPFGGADPVLTTNPIAYGIPTHDDPILIDLCTSVVSNAALMSYQEKNQPLPGNWLLDNEGRPTNDPFALKTTPPGTIMPIGGQDFGYKGFALGLMVEAFTLALSGYGRTGQRSPFGEGVFIQIIDPDHFAGKAAFQEEMSALAQRCRQSRVPEGGNAVRLPGERALRRMEETARTGIDIPASLIETLKPWMERYAVALAT